MTSKKLYVKCKLCDTVIYRITTQTLILHLAKQHKIKELLFTGDRLADYYHISDFSTIELIEFMCPSCYKRKDGFNKTCYMNRESYETDQAVPYCAWCKKPMELRRKKDKDRYG